MNFNELAEIVDDAAMNCKPTQQLSEHHTFSEDDAYKIQQVSIARRLDRGESFIGLKMGFTSKAKMIQMGVNDLIWGRLTSTMNIKNGDSIDLNKFIHPRAEPEVCFLVKQDITTEVALEDVGEYIEAIAPAIEIIDSRYKDFKFSLEDVIADNCSSAGLIIGDWKELPNDIADLKIELKIDNEVVEEGSTANILGNPLLSFVDATRLAVKYEQPIYKGNYIMAGSATAAKYLASGQHVKAIVEGLGEVEFKVK